MKETEGSLDELVDAVRAAPKYRQVDESLIRNIGSRELEARRNLKDAIKATKNKLHQVGGAYFNAPIDYAAALEQLRRASGSGDPETLRQTCKDILRLHASTQERLDILDRFYTTVLADCTSARTVLDIACGLNPLAIPWMPLNEIEYHAYDIYADMAGFIGDFLKLIGVRGGAQTCDVVHSPPTRKADLALVLKALPCLEQIDKSAGFRLLHAINADVVVVSFPVRSLGGWSKGMLVNYQGRFMRLSEEENWKVQRFEFESELAFVIRKA